MAVKFEDLRNDLINSPLTKDELDIISKVEAYIDDELIYHYDTNSYGISIDSNIINFKIDPINNNFLNLKEGRKNIMTKELIKRYEEVGWKIDFIAGQDDGPNRPGFDMYKFKGK